jgi:hypothetical protein
MLLWWSRISYSLHFSLFLLFPAPYQIRTRGCIPGYKAAGTWSRALISIYFRGREWVYLYSHYLIRLIEQWTNLPISYTNIKVHHNLVSYVSELVSRDIVVGIATGYGVEGRGVGVRVPVRSRIFSSPCRRKWIWDPPSLLSNGNRWLFPRG